MKQCLSVLTCGHSSCLDCSGALKSCPLCRVKIASTFLRKPNYALLSILDKMAKRKPPQTESQCCQTEPEPQVPVPQPSKERTRRRSVSFGKDMVVSIKRGAIEIAFK